MKLRKILLPNIIIALALAVFWFAGVETIVKSSDDFEVNIQKYVQVQKQILDNYVDKVDLNDLYKYSIRGLVRNLDDSTATLKDTPADTTFGSVNIGGLRKSVEEFQQAYRYIANTYPEEDMDQRTEDAIRGMFKMLDPHSVYIRAKDSEAIEEQFEGKFQGIGVQFQVIQDTVTVVSAIAGGPSEKLGIQSGDRIIAVGDSSAVGFSNADVRDALRGPKGSTVDVTIKRPSTNKNIDFTIVRDDIPLYTVDTSYMLDDETGYVKINRFAATTHEEFMEALSDLKDKGMDRIVLDLRGNPGGYLSQAIAIAEEFFPEETKLVSTKSRHRRFTTTYFSRKNGQYRDTPVIILVDEGSASASEIVSGAVQDHDRGLIVGQRTFGKGLVQQQYGLVDSSNIRVTISKYYTPSGRLIQKPYSNKGNEEYAYEILKRENNAVTDVNEYISHVPDSLRYTTDAGRTVYGGGGIVPDHIVQRDTTQSAVVIGFMRQKQIAFNFVRTFLDKNGDDFRAQWEDDYDGFRENFEWNAADIDTIYSTLMKNNMAVSDTLSEPDFTDSTLVIPEGYFEDSEPMVKGILKAELANQVWGLKRYYPIINDMFDDEIEVAMKYWDQAGAYANHQAGKELDQSVDHDSE